MQYRMHPSISIFPNISFYERKLLDAPNVMQKKHQKNYLPGSMFGSYSFFNIEDGREDLDELGHSRKNVVEVAVVQEILRNLQRGMCSLVTLFSNTCHFNFSFFFLVVSLGFNFSIISW